MDLRFSWLLLDGSSLYNLPTLTTLSEEELLLLLLRDPEEELELELYEEPVPDELEHDESLESLLDEEDERQRRLRRLLRLLRPLRRR